ncbi:type II toxin-antitoxin system RelE/ParE family toxin [Undibacterium sp. TJN19]|uniref:type II toxin-antitoxin system RelE/ParE family toxin n=1 Tax=Undibacterium sp. TJN19 TaxID=3413055 RepID=UPI003BEF51D4
MKLVWKQQALADRESLINDLAQDQPQAALELDEAIEHCAEQLLASTAVYQPGRMNKTHEALIRKGYVMVYALEGDKLCILRILHHQSASPVSAKKTGAVSLRDIPASSTGYSELTDQHKQAEIFHHINSEPVRLVAHAIPFEHGPVIHIDIFKGDDAIAAARIMPPYHSSLIGVRADKSATELAHEVLKLFSTGALHATLGRVMQARQHYLDYGLSFLPVIYQNPGDVKA